MGKDLYHLTSGRELISKICKELKKVGIKIPNNPIKKGGYSANQRVLNGKISNGQKTPKGNATHP